MLQFGAFYFIKSFFLATGLVPLLILDRGIKKFERLKTEYTTEIPL